ncbi:hypothetical protein ACQB6R_13260 [Propionibacteriaceae bacterium G1746]|uniref:hypothetical protein n=1 Tax=Aestuariimicrobium sp. G57 TaxID=3418485 RepID=UPI003C1A575D
MSDERDALYEWLAIWRDQVVGLLTEREVPMVTVELLELPGAATIKVSPRTDIAPVIAWAEPTLAFISPPGDERPFFIVGLVGGPGREVVLICGEPPSAPDEQVVELTEDDVNWTPIFDHVENAVEELIVSDNFHFGNAAAALTDAARVLEYAFPEGQTDAQTLMVVQFPALRFAMVQLMEEARTRQKRIHQRHLLDHPEQIARELLAGPDVARFEGLTITAATPEVYRILKSHDPCVTKEACAPVARAVVAQLRRR